MFNNVAYMIGMRGPWWMPWWLFCLIVLAGLLFFVWLRTTRRGKRWRQAAHELFRRHLGLGEAEPAEDVQHRSLVGHDSASTG